MVTTHNLSKLCSTTLELSLLQCKFMNVFQRWQEGDEAYHQELMVPALLIYGAQDKFVTLEEEEWMQEVSEKNT